MEDGGIYFGVGLILLFIIIYLAMIRLKVKEIIAEVNGSRRTVEELFTIKTKKIIQLKAIIEPRATPKIKDLFRKLDHVLDDFIKSTTEEKIIKSEDINSILNQIIAEAKNDKNLILDEYFHTITGELGAINTRLVYAKRAYMEDINQYEKMRNKFPFSIFPWPRWEFGMSSVMVVRRKSQRKQLSIPEEAKPVEKKEEEKDKRSSGVELSEEEKMALQKIKNEQKKQSQEEKMEKTTPSIPQQKSKEKRKLISKKVQKKQKTKQRKKQDTKTRIRKKSKK